MKRIVLALFGASILLFSSCVKEAGTGTSTVNFQLKAAVSPVNGAAITWTIGSAGVYSTKIQGKKSDSTSVEFKAIPAIQVDLFSTINISNVAIPTGTYRGLQFTIELHDIGGKAPLRLEGTYTAGGVTTPIVFEVSGTTIIKCEKESIVIDANTASYTAITTLGLVTLTSDVTEADLKAADRTSGKIVISASTNVFVYNKMVANLAKNQVIEFK
jgi:hypothetical protein